MKETKKYTVCVLNSGDKPLFFNGTILNNDVAYDNYNSFLLFDDERIGEMQIFYRYIIWIKEIKVGDRGYKE